MRDSTKKELKGWLGWLLFSLVFASALLTAFEFGPCEPDRTPRTEISTVNE